MSEVVPWRDGVIRGPRSDLAPRYALENSGSGMERTSRDLILRSATQWREVMHVA
jgi:hypothetical protein